MTAPRRRWTLIGRLRDWTMVQGILAGGCFGEVFMGDGLHGPLGFSFAVGAFSGGLIGLAIDVFGDHRR